MLIWMGEYAGCLWAVYSPFLLAFLPSTGDMMKNITLKVILSIIICAILVMLIIGKVSYSNSEKVFNQEMKEKLSYASGKYANEFNLVFQNQQSMVDSLCATVSVIFDTEEYQQNRLLFQKKKKVMDDIIRDMLKDSGTTVKALYITFNPETSKGNDEIWYIIDENGKEQYLDARGMTEIWLDEENSYDDYYFDAIRYGSDWSGAYYDLGLKEDTLTYSKAVYDKNHALIGVVGADILAGDIVKTVQNMKIYDGGQSVLLDVDYKYIIGSSGESSFQKMNNEEFRENIVAIKENNGIFRYPQSGAMYIATCSQLFNGWILIFSQPEKAATAPIAYMEKIILTIGILVIAAAAVYAVVFSRKSFKPILYEAEQKDIMIINQSRQAKLGEMVGNIAHQWKQPLNAMSITLSNLTDDFRHHELDEKTFKEHIDKMYWSIRTMSNTADDFADFLKPNRRKEEFCVNDEIKKALKLMEESIKVNSITVEIQGAEGVKAFGFRNEFSQGIFNVLDNARDAIIESNPEERSITITIQKLPEKWQGQIGAVIDIYNRGTPISQEVMQNMFNPYYTTKEKDGGTGIGLYITKQIIEEHLNGSIRFINDEGGVHCIISVLTEVGESWS